MIHQHDRQHRLGDRRGAQSDARIVAPGGHHLDRDCRPDRWCARAPGCSRSASDSGAPRSAARRICRRACRRHDWTRSPSGVSSSRCSLPRWPATATPSPISTALTALMPIIACGDIGIELVEHRLAQPRRHAFGAHRDARADRIAGGAHIPDQLLELGQALRVGAEERILVGRGRARAARASAAPIWLR